MTALLGRGGPPSTPTHNILWIILLVIHDFS